MIVDTQNHPVTTRSMLRKQNEDGEEEDEDENDCTKTCAGWLRTQFVDKRK